MKPVVPARKVVHVTECAASGVLGFLILATHELAASGLTQTVVYSRRPDSPPDLESRFPAGVRLVELPPPAAGHRRYLARLRDTLIAECEVVDETAVHLHSSKAGFLGRLALLGLRRRPRLYYSPHGLAFLDRRWLLPSLAFAALEWLAARVDATLVGCSRSEAQLLTRLGGGRPARVLENAVDDRFFAVRPLGTSVPQVVTIGRVCRQKAPERFAALATRFQIAEVEARFVWIGDGDPSDVELLRAAGVKVTGWLPPERVAHRLSRAAVYVQTSRWEGMPLSVLQALAAGVPSVVTDVVGNRDAVRQGLTGYVVGSQEEMLMAVRRLLGDGDLHARFARAARADARRRFSAAALRARLCRLYGLPLPDPEADVLPQGVHALHRIARDRRGPLHDDAVPERPATADVGPVVDAGALPEDPPPRAARA